MKTERPVDIVLWPFYWPLAAITSITHRITGVALFVGDWAVAQLWLFWVAPIVGALMGAVVYRFIGSEQD